MAVSIFGRSHAANIIYLFACRIVFLIMTSEHVLLAVLWMLYGIVHSVLANTTVKRRIQQNLGAYYKYYRLTYNLIAFAGLIAIVLFQVSIDSIPLFKPNKFSDILGGLITVSGALLMFICIKKYFAGFSGLHSFWKEEAPDQLIMSGVHRFVRHPLYLGTFAFIWGLVILFPTLSLLISNSVITIYTLIGIQFEERKLLAAFGDQYREYQRKVPKIIPKF